MLQAAGLGPLGSDLFVWRIPGGGEGVGAGVFDQLRSKEFGGQIDRWLTLTHIGFSVGFHRRVVLWSLLACVSLGCPWSCRQFPGV